jgi:hypothetical protein
VSVRPKFKCSKGKLWCRLRPDRLLSHVWSSEPVTCSSVLYRDLSLFLGLNWASELAIRQISSVGRTANALVAKVRHLFARIRPAAHILHGLHLSTALRCPATAQWLVASILALKGPMSRIKTPLPSTNTKSCHLVFHTLSNFMFCLSRMHCLQNIATYLPA